jgi:transposase
MVHRRISNDIKERALYLLLEKGWTMERVVEALGVSSRSVSRWEENYEQHGSVSHPSVLRGRRRLLTRQMTEELDQLLTECPSLLVDEIGEWLALYHDQPIFTTALHGNLRDLGITYNRLKRAAVERDDVYRAEWLHNVAANYTADQLLFPDESSKDDRTILRRYGRAISRKPAVDAVPLDLGVWYSIPALTIDGYMAVRVVEGSIDGAEFYDFVLNDVVSSVVPDDMLHTYNI